MYKELIYQVDSTQQKERLDKFIAKNSSGITRSYAEVLIAENKVFVNDLLKMKNYTLKPGDVVKILLPQPKVLTLEPQNISIEIIYQDDDLLVVNKPKGMVVHPAAGHLDNTLVNALLYHCKGKLSTINGVIRPGIVHRIDKDTSGLLIIAKNDASHQNLAEQIKRHSFKREYQAVVCGVVKKDSGVITLPIGRHQVQRKKMAVTGKNSKPAVTHYQVIKRYNNYTYIKFILETGRTHQIRVHSAYIGHPVAADEVYGKKNQNLPFKGQCLHAKTIGFIHPTTNEYLQFSSTLPMYFKDFLHSIEQSE